MYGANVGPTANPLTRLRVPNHNVRCAYLGLEVKVAVGQSPDVSLNDVSVCFRSHWSPPVFGRAGIRDRSRSAQR